jgi:hypothetical protein
MAAAPATTAVAIEVPPMAVSVLFSSNVWVLFSLV